MLRPFALRIAKDQLFPFFILGLVWLTVRFALINVFGNITPFWDQWGAEANKLYKPWIEGTLPLSELFSPHGEHRIFITRIYSIALLEINGRVWNPILQMVTNSVISVAGLLMLTYCASQSINSDLKKYLYLFAGFLFCIPFGWENTLWGFQSQFYLYILFSVVFLWCMATKVVFSSGWWMGIAIGLLTPLTLASGPFTLISGGVVLIARDFNQKNKNPRVWVIAISLLVIAFSFVLATPSRHSDLKAKDLLEFIATLLAIGAWPTKLYFLGVLLNIPIVAYMIRVIKSRPPISQTNYFILGLGFWFFGQCVAIAYGRAQGYASSRYLDLFSIGLLINFVSLLCLVQTSKNRRSWKLYSVGWVVVIVFSLLATIKPTATELVVKSHQSKTQEENVRAYLCGAGMPSIEGKPHLSIPYPWPDRLAGFLDNTTIRGILPPRLVQCSDN